MGVLFVLIPLSVGLAGIALAGCIWAIRSGQYDDVESPAQQLVFEDLEDAGE